MNDVAAPVKATKFTPGPWRRNGSYIERPKMALHVATVAIPALGSAPEKKAEADANGDLIAAAREMYDALKAFNLTSDMVAGGTADTLFLRVPISVLQTAAAAIAKAEGR